MFILLFTFGALAGLPLGYGTAKFIAERVQPAVKLGIEAFSLFVALDHTLCDLDALVDEHRDLFKTRWPA
jgi:hypothetical protein